MRRGPLREPAFRLLFAGRAVSSFGVVGSFFNAMWFTAMQQSVPAEEISRLTSWDAVGSYALQPVGLALVGPLAAVIGVSTTLYGAGIIFLVITVGVIAMPSVWNFKGGAASHPTELAPVPSASPPDAPRGPHQGDLGSAKGRQDAS